MKFFIPEIADRIKLTEDADMYLLNAGVNTTILRATPSTSKQIDDDRAKMPTYRYHPSGDPEYAKAWADYDELRYHVYLPKDTILSVARVYIRKGASDFSSVTFNILECPRKIYSLKKAGGTWNHGIRNFFLNLHQLNCLEFEPA